MTPARDNVSPTVAVQADPATAAVQKEPATAAVQKEPATAAVQEKAATAAVQEKAATAAVQDDPKPQVAGARQDSPHRARSLVWAIVETVLVAGILIYGALDTPARRHLTGPETAYLSTLLQISVTSLIAFAIACASILRNYIVGGGWVRNAYAFALIAVAECCTIPLYADAGGGLGAHALQLLVCARGLGPAVPLVLLLIWFYSNWAEED